MQKDKPVEYVKICPIYGPGFFYIPGSNTCIKVGGNAWSEANYKQVYAHAVNPFGTRTSLKVSLDARTATEYGLLRTVVEPQISTRTGSDNSGSAKNSALNFAGTNTEGVGTSGKQTQFNAISYIQFGGFTTGHMGSFFSAAAPASNIGIDGYDQRDLTNTAAYTAALGNGITATVGVEDGTLVNREGVFNAREWAATATTLTGSAASTGLSAPAMGIATVSNTTNPNAITYGANRLPDYVANLAVTQSWGSAQLSGAVHTINTTGMTAANYNGQTAIGTQYGYALQANTKINLPMIAAGDYLWLNGIYTYAANAYSLRNSGAGDATSNGISLGIGHVAVTMNDLVYDSTNKVAYKPTVWGVGAEFNHQWTPTVGTFLGGSYTSLSWDAAAQAIAPAAVNPAKVAIATAGVTWVPVSGLQVLADVEYAQISVKTATNGGLTAEAAKKNQDQVIGRIRIKRDF